MVSSQRVKGLVVTRSETAADLPIDESAIERVALAQEQDSLSISVHWASHGPLDLAFALRALSIGRFVPVAHSSVGAVSHVAVDLAVVASSRSTAWTLWFRAAGREWIRVGGVPTSSTALTPVVHGDAVALPKVTGHESFVIQTGGAARPLAPVVATKSVAAGGHSPSLEWRGTVTVSAQLEAEIQAIVVERTSGIVHTVPLVLNEVGSTRSLLKTFEAGLNLPWRGIQPVLGSEWLDPFIEVTYDGFAATRVGLRRPRLGQRLRHHFGDSRVNHHDDVVRYYGPFYTFKASRLAAHVSRLSLDADAELRRMRRGLRLRRLHYRATHRPLWIIGETGYKAQDTGYHFFKYVVENHPEIDARFVIGADAPDRQRVEAVGPVLIHGSVEHVQAILVADRVVTSHHPEYLYPVRTNALKRSVRATRVFLQHGVMGTKWMANLYGRGNAGFETDVFLVSSPGEKRMIERDFGYRADQVTVTGLSRFDALLAPAEPESQLLIIPTWRDWILDTDRFESSDFYREWLGLISSEDFRAAVKAGGWRVRMILHPNFRQFAPIFEAQGVDVVKQGEQTVQELLRESAILLTDYSSVAFDFALQRRPVVYFQFDRRRFLGRAGSHLDLDEALPGTIAFDESEVVAALTNAANPGGTVADEVFERATSFFPMMDRNSSARVFDAVVAARLRRVSPWQRRAKSLAASVYRRWRKSGFYFPLAKALYRAVRLLPLDNNRVLFESGLGRQYGDSPRAIYEALAISHPDLRKTWAYNRRIPTDDEATDTVLRLSLRYFVALARSKYLVNNQSFPFYVTRRRDQVFLQTWHGTPLKKMANDLAEVHGRDDGYIARATRGAQQWSVLVSPNKYTTAIMRSAFRFSGRALEVGYPRNDLLHGDSAARAAARVRHQYSIPSANRVVLFAPTFRDRAINGVDAVVPTATLDLAAWLQEFDADTTLVVRRHVLDNARASLPDGSEGRIVDATAYPDIQDLLASADVLVTDYSSLYFDYLNLRRPIVFFAPDLEDYRDVLRGFYLDYSTDLPGPVATTATQARGLVREALTSGCFSGYDLDAFAERFCPHDDGHAAQRIVDYIFPVAEDR